MHNSYKDLTELSRSFSTIRDTYIQDIGGVVGKDMKTPAKFSYVNPVEEKFSTDDYVTIYPFSKSVEEFICCGDISYQSGNITYSDFLQSLPYVQIRAYEPHTILQYVTNILDTVSAGISYAKNTDISSAIKNIKSGVTEYWNSVTAFFSAVSDKVYADEFYQNIIKRIDNGFSIRNGKRYSSRLNDILVLDLPYNLYYKILGSTTNAIYQIPYIPSNSTELLDSDGSFGWHSNNVNYDDITSKFSMGSDKKETNSAVSALSENALIKSLLSQVINKFNITVMPQFNPSGATTSAGSISITFSLVNDNIVSALNNFSFIQTLLANNKIIQNLISYRPSNLYDIKIPGVTRTLMCTGDFSVQPIGALRTVPIYRSRIEGVSNSVVENIRNTYGEDFRIPESYSVTLTFNSLIPENFNVYMLGMISANENLFLHNNNSSRFEPGVIGKLNDAITISAEEMITKYRKANDPKPDYKAAQ